MPSAEKPYDHGELVAGPHLSVFVKLLLPNAFEEHSHAHGQVTLFLDGAGETNWRTKLGRRQSHSFEGSFVWLTPPFRRHSLRLTRPTRVASLYLEPALLAETNGLRWHHPSIEPLSHYVHQDGLIAELVRQIRNFFSQRPGDHRLQSTAGLFVHQVMEVHLAPRRQELAVSHGLSDAVATHLRRFIATRFTEKVTRSELAREAGGLSPWHFGRMFAVTFGEPPGRFLQRYRLARAREKLEENPETTVTAVAHACGFPGHNQFTAHFKRRYEVTPIAFLHRLRRTRARIKG